VVKRPVNVAQVLKQEQEGDSKQVLIIIVGVCKSVKICPY